MPAPAQGGLKAAVARTVLLGFLLFGMLLSFLGAFLPAWEHHVEPRYAIIGHYFLSMNLGILLAARLSYRLLGRRGIGFALSLACGIASAMLFLLAFFSPPSSPWWRVGVLFGLGFGAGILCTSLFQAIWPVYRHNPAAVTNLAGSLFGFGCLVTALIVAATFHFYTAASMMFLLGVVPLFFLGLYARTSFPAPVALAQPPPGQILAEFRNLAAILLALLLFFQFGNEWAVGAWLPLYLIQILGTSPEFGLLMLSLYWLALLVGRVVAQAILPRVPHFRFLLVSVASAMLGLVILTFTNNSFGVVTGILMVGGGFAVVYPLVVEMIGARFPYYHPGVINGIFSVAATGSMLSPATLGYFAELWGIRVVVGVPLLGTFAVAVLILLIWLENRLSGPR